ncbi:MAG: HD domain-containing protein [Oscillospiraceae bacterium]|nr:HD domain-containing protein [Oscillospiraceae bacterium]
MARIVIPVGPALLMARLNTAGFEAQVVGGCVRDSLLGRRPNDWDICTSARPEQIQRCFQGERVIETGLKHGTVTVLLEGVPYEITTYRTDGAYSDGRHPDSVQFVSSLKADLARRDFTINAMAAGPDGLVQDPYGGQMDLAAGIIRCVGDPALRFQEDALRLLRAMRFASTYKFIVEEGTRVQIHQQRALLTQIAGERIQVELEKLLMGCGVRPVLEEFHDVLSVVIPELAPLAGFAQHNPWHLWDIWQHTIIAIDQAIYDPIVRLALLLHDIAKPAVFTLDKRGIGHFYGHAQAGSEDAKILLRRLRYDNETRHNVATLVAVHDTLINPEAKSVRRWLNRLGESQLRRLFAVKRADTLAHNPALTAEELASLEQAEKQMDQILEEGQCFSLKDLAVNGRDLIAAGLHAGPTLGIVLRQLMDLVLDGSIENDRQALLDHVKTLASD